MLLYIVNANISFCSSLAHAMLNQLYRYAIIWPVFIFFLILFWIFALVFLVTSLSGSDFCVKPDQVVEGTLEQYKDRFHSVIFTFLIYYVSGCKVRPDGEGSKYTAFDQLDVSYFADTNICIFYAYHTQQTIQVKWPRLPDQ